VFIRVSIRRCYKLMVLRVGSYMGSDGDGLGVISVILLDVIGFTDKGLSIRFKS
jgi:hypothetical protein